MLFRSHLQLRLILEAKRPITTNDQMRSLWGRAAMGLDWLLFRRGALAIGINQGGLFTRVNPESATPDIQFHFSTLSADMAGGTITITNVGVFGVDGGTPIINPGESAILAMCRAVQKPWVVDGQVVPRHVMQLTLSFDQIGRAHV